ncbi:MAG: adenylate/guanylate cyclase domain-containing protein [Bacteroidales bacterium]|jgi:class 3 adenylate cyclase|nr:adenylate/guanylate cyclase domain-containing protein [Bacteroidales bacterium]
MTFKFFHGKVLSSLLLIAGLWFPGQPGAGAGLTGQKVAEARPYDNPITGERISGQSAGVLLSDLQVTAGRLSDSPEAGRANPLKDSCKILNIRLYRSGDLIDMKEEMPVLEHREGIVFTMENDGAAEYSFFMAGPDTEWSTWTGRSYKEYTNLSRGRYTFMYRYRARGGDMAGEGSFAFRVKAPWYFSPLAWIIYPLLLAFIALLIRRQTHRRFMERQKRLEELIAERTEELQHEKEKSDNLLANMLPHGTAQEIMSKGKAAKTKYNFVTVLFSDIQGFTKIAEEMNPEVLIDELDRFFFHFDSVTQKYRIEKIKTIGDAYMCAGGIPERNRTNPVEVVLAALEMQKYMQFMRDDPANNAARFWDIRIGIHTGTVIAGVVGHTKLTYDIWGDTVNTASRMESSGEAGKINISGTTHEFVKEYFTCEYRGRMPVKYKGDLDMYFVTGIRPEFCEPDGLPNRKFFNRIEMIRILDVEEHVFAKYSENASPDLFFHSLEHIRSVCLQADLLARAEKLDDRDYINLRLASVFIFYGYVLDYADPASAARKRAEEILAVYGFEKETLDVVTGLMETAFQPHQESMAGMVMHDAVYDFTGRVDFISMADRLYREEMAYGKAYDPKAWFRKMISMVEQNPFLTETARRLQSVPHDEQVRALRSFADEKLTGI